jgi:hypothetical protein
MQKANLGKRMDRWAQSHPIAYALIFGAALGLSWFVARSIYSSSYVTSGVSATVGCFVAGAIVYIFNRNRRSSQ